MAALEELDFEPEENDDMGSGEVEAAAPARVKAKVNCLGNIFRSDSWAVKM